VLTKKETKYSYNAFQARDKRDKSECDSAVYSNGTSMEHRVAIFIWQPRWNMISAVIFAGALTIFAGALPPWAPPW